MDSKLILIENEDFEYKKENFYCFWKNDPIKKKNTFSLISIIKENEILIKNELFETINFFTNKETNNKSIIEYLKYKNISSYYFSILYEKSNLYKTTNYLEVLKFIALEKWIEKNQVSEIKVLAKNKVLIQSINSLCKKKNIKLTIVKKPKNKFTIPNFYKGIFTIFLFAVSFLPATFLNKRFWIKKKSKSIFVSYFDNINTRDLNNQVFTSNYWGDILKIIDVKKDSRWLHIYAKDSLNKNIFASLKTLICINKFSSNNHLLVEQFYSFKLFVKSIIYFLAYFYKYIRARKHITKLFDKYYQLNFIKNDFIKSVSGSGLGKNIIYYLLFQKVFRIIPIQESCFYLQENQVWESLLIKNYKESGHNNIIGYLNTIINSWDFRFYNRYLDVNQNKYNPNYILVNNKMSYELLLNNGVKKDNLIQVEASRYFHLLNFNKKKPNDKNIKQILICGEYNNERTIYLLNFIDLFIKSYKNENLNFYFKSHPNNIKHSINKSIEIKHENLSVLLKEIDVVITTPFTNVPIECLYTNTQCICLDFEDQINTSPFKYESNINFISNIQQLNNILKNQILIDDDSSFLFLDPKFNLWKSFLNKINY